MPTMKRSQFDNPVFQFGWKTVALAVAVPYLGSVVLLLLGGVGYTARAYTIPYDGRIALIVIGIALAVIWTPCWIVTLVRHMRFKREQSGQ